MGQRKTLESQDPQALLAQAQKAMEGKDWRQGLECFRALLRRRCQEKTLKLAALLGYAQCLLALGRGPEAERVLRKALRLDPQNPQARELLVSALIASGRWETALRHAQRWMNKKPSDWRANLLLARLYHALNEKGIFQFHLWVALHHGHQIPSVLQTASQLLEQQGRLREAIAVMFKAVKEFPKDAQSWARLGFLLQKERKLRRALQCLERAIELGFDTPTARLMAGQICSDLGQLERAVTHLQKGLEQDPNNLDLLNLLSFVYLQQGQLQEALKTLHRFLALAPTDPVAHFKVASLHYQMGNYAEAVRAYRQVIALAPGTEVAQEAQEILEMIDHVQLEQIFVLSMEDPVFRASLMRDPQQALEAKGFLLSESSLEVIANTDFSRLPKRWRSPQSRAS